MGKDGNSQGGADGQEEQAGRWQCSLAVWLWSAMGDGLTAAALLQLGCCQPLELSLGGVWTEAGNLGSLSPGGSFEVASDWMSADMRWCEHPRLIPLLENGLQEGHGVHEPWGGMVSKSVQTPN